MKKRGMRIATWNVNSVRARLARVLGWLEQQQPDLLCLQETKVQDDAFPRGEIEALGYQVACFGQKTYNGVALVARGPLSDIRKGFGDEAFDDQARILSGVLNKTRVVSVYVPNGGEVDGPKWAYKRAWLSRLRAHVQELASRAEPVLICGDFNVAPDDRDAAFPDRWTDSVLCHEDVRLDLKNLLEAGLIDLYRAASPDGAEWTWWDYRRLAFPKGDGLRIDLALGTAAIRKRVERVWVDRDARKGKQPSDHAPVVVDLK